MRFSSMFFDQLPTVFAPVEGNAGTPNNAHTDAPVAVGQQMRIGDSPINYQFVSLPRLGLGLAMMIMLLMPKVSWSQSSIAATSTNYSQDFNTLTNGTWADNTTLTGWYARTDATASITTYGANTGSTTGSGLYAFGVAGTNPLSDRALGFVASNTFTGGSGTGKGYMGWRLKNNTGVSVSSISVTWTGEQWRRESNTSAHTLVLTYQKGSTVTSLTGGTWTAANSIFTSPITGTAGGTAIDGNASANRTANITATISVTLAAGEEIMLRWEDLNDANNDHFIAIDDVSVSAASAPPTISTTGTPAALSTIYGTASANTSFNVAGTNLTAGVNVAAPAGFEVSTSTNSGFAASTTVGAAGTFAATPVYVRLASTTIPGTYSGNLVLTSAGATTVNVATTASTVSQKQLTISGLTADNKSYDGNTDATLSGTPALVGIVNGNSVMLEGDPVANFNTADVGTAKPVTVTGYTLGGTHAAYYTLAQPTGLTADITQATQTITFNALDPKTEGDAPFALTATASSGLVITYTSSDQGVATVSGSTVTIVAAGSTVITASQAGSSNYLAAADVMQTLTVAPNGKINQTITFAPLSNATYGDVDFGLTATASSGLTVTYTSSDPDVATVSGSTVTVVGVGTTTIIANQAGDATYNPAPAVSQTLTIDPKPISVTGVTADNKVYDGTTSATLAGTPMLVGVEPGDDVTVTGTPTATFADANVATAIDVSVIGYTLGGADAANYSIVQPTGLTADITIASQTITFDPLTPQIVGAPNFFLTATASSGLPVSYTSSDPNVASVSGNVVTIVGAGSTIITASQGGNSNYNPAADVQQTQVVVTTLALWNFTAGNAVSVAPPVSNLTVLDLTRGNNNGSTGLVTTTSSSNNYPSASGTFNAGAATFIGALNTNTSTYFEFILNPAPGFKVEVTGLFHGSRSTSTGPLAYSLRSSADNYASSITSGTYSNISAWIPYLNSGFSSVSGAGSAITYRLYGYNGTGTPSAGSANWRIDDLSVLGSVQCATPGAFFVLGGGAACSAGSGASVSLDGSELGMNYQLKKDGADVGSPISGTGGGISFPNVTESGTYTVTATNTNGVCNLTTDMIGSATVTVITATTYYTDGDNDGYGAGAPFQSCDFQVGAVTVNGDCDDNNSSIHPDAPELCNGVDDNCDFILDLQETSVAFNPWCSPSPTPTGRIFVLPVGGVSPYSYTWSDGFLGGNDNAGLDVGTYSCTITDANGCQVVATKTLTAVPIVINVTLTHNLCNGGNKGRIVISPTGGSGYFLYNWSNGATTKVISALTAGSYTCTVTDGLGGCTQVLTNTITQPDPLAVTIQSVAAMTTAPGKYQVVLNSATGGTPAYLYRRTTPTGFTAYTPSTTFTKLFPATYTFIVKDANGCTSSVTSAVPQSQQAALADRDAQTSKLAGVEMLLSPNPASNVLNISFANEKALNGNVHVYDSYGRLVLQQGANLPIGGGNLSIALDALVSGTYRLQFRAENGEPLSKYFVIVR